MVLIAKEQRLKILINVLKLKLFLGVYREAIDNFRQITENSRCHFI